MSLIIDGGEIVTINNIPEDFYDLYKDLKENVIKPFGIKNLCLWTSIDFTHKVYNYIEKEYPLFNFYNFTEYMEGILSIKVSHKNYDKEMILNYYEDDLL